VAAIYLKIPGYNGLSRVRNHLNEFELESFSLMTGGTELEFSIKRCHGSDIILHLALVQPIGSFNIDRVILTHEQPKTARVVVKFSFDRVIITCKSVGPKVDVFQMSYAKMTTIGGWAVIKP
jgi:hypothetical protein